ncbi:hypothetical protein Tco_1259512 [Tanacetum coccineum]
MIVPEQVTTKLKGGVGSDEYKDNDRFWGSKSGVNESNAKPSFSDISKAKACILAKASESSSKDKVQASRSKAKVQASVAQASPKNLIFKTLREEREEEDCRWKLILPFDVFCSDSSDDSKGVPKEGSSIASVHEEGPSIQGLLDWYGYDTVGEYLEDTYFPSTYKDTTDKDNTDEDTIHESYSPMSKVCHVQLECLVTSKHFQVASKHFQVAIEACRSRLFAKITRKEPKPDKNEHGNGKNTQETGKYQLRSTKVNKSQPKVNNGQTTR